MIGQIQERNGELKDIHPSITRREKKLIETHLREKQINKCIVKGIELDRYIRAALVKVIPLAVYMVEPNTGFYIENAKQLSKMSWMGQHGPMHTESRRLIFNAIKKEIYDENKILFTREGGIQTEIDNEWRKNNVNAFETITKSTFWNCNFQTALRTLHQSYAQPELWANNVYLGLRVTISQYKKEGVGPIKVIRDLFDPIPMKKVRFVDNTHKGNLQSILSVFDDYVAAMWQYHIEEKKKEPIAQFFKNFRVSSKNEKEDWTNFLKWQMDIFAEKKKILAQHYVGVEIDLIVSAAIETGRAIQAFYKENIEP